MSEVVYGGHKLFEYLLCETEYSASYNSLWIITFVSGYWTWAEQGMLTAMVCTQWVILPVYGTASVSFMSGYPVAWGLWRKGNVHFSFYFYQTITDFSTSKSIIHVVMRFLVVVVIRCGCHPFKFSATRLSSVNYSSRLLLSLPPIDVILTFSSYCNCYFYLIVFITSLTSFY